MDTILSKIDSSSVKLHPFPHIVVRNAIPKELQRDLIKKFPQSEVVSQGRPLGDNTRFSLPASEVEKSTIVSALWKDFIATHASQAFLGDIVRVFGEHIRTRYPSIEGMYGLMDAWRAGVRNVSTFDEATVLLDAQICVNTPVIKRPTSVRGAHIDNAQKLFVGLLYLRPEEDDSTGGDLMLYRWKRGRPYLYARQWTHERYVEPIDTIRYESGTLIMFINSLDSLHGVTVRGVTKYPRLFMNLLGEVRNDLFDPTLYGETLSDKVLRRLHV